MKWIITISAILLFALAGCGKDKQSTNELITVDVTKNYPEKELMLQDFMDVEYIPLETNDEFVTQGKVMAIGAEVILITNWANDGNLFVFDRKTGKALKKINRKGQGGEEYVGITEVVLDEANKDEFTMWKDYNWRNNMVPQREYMANYCDESGTPFMEIPGYNFHGLMRYQVKKDHYWKTFRENDSRLTGTLKAVYQKQEDGSIKYIAPFAYKFQGTTLEGSNERNWLDDYPIYRYADALLLLAEAKALLGEDPSTEINAVRERAYGSEYFNAHKNEVAYPNDKGSFYNDNPFEGGDENVMEAILKERLREFFFEGKRWYDLRRFGNQYVLKYTTAQESRLLWPINEDALTNNPALKQTPGY